MKHIALALAFMSVFQIAFLCHGAHAASSPDVKGTQRALQGKIVSNNNSLKKQNAAEKKSTGEALESRIDFGNSYILGQTIKSGAVYLLQRKKSEIKSMLKQRKDYREEILEEFHITDMKTDNK